jgi:hypothetical protein
MPSFGKFLPVDRVSIDVSNERVVSIFNVEGISKLESTLAISSSPILSTVKREATRSSEASIVIRSTPLHIPEDGILHVNS